MQASSLLKVIKTTVKMPHFNMRHLCVLLAVHLAGGRADLGVTARGLGLQVPVASRMAYALARFGLVQHEENGDDRRKVFIELTPRGRAFVRNLEAA